MHQAVGPVVGWLQISADKGVEEIVDLYRQQPESNHCRGMMFVGVICVPVGYELIEFLILDAPPTVP